jgi:serine/threonine protein kinase
LSDFTDFEIIGEGHFGKVFKAKSKKTDKIYALKCIKKSSITEPQEFDNLAAEREVLSSVNHPFIAKMHCAFQTKDTLWFVMDYLSGGELFFHLRDLGKFTEETACFYAAQIVLAVEYLHSKNIMYRDLKPENILLDQNGNAVLTDFGLAKLGMKADKRTKTIWGTPEYLAPEIIQNKPYDKSADWWSLGILLYEMLSGKHPYKTKNNDKEAMYKKIVEIPVKMRPEFSKEAKSLINGLLAIKNHNRLGCSDLGADEIKYHEFFRSVTWSMIEEKRITPPIDPKSYDNNALYGYLKKKQTSLKEILAELTEEELESASEMGDMDAQRLTRTTNIRNNRTVKKSHRYFENFEFQRSQSTKSK